jgi:hypothetical protein
MKKIPVLATIRDAYNFTFTHLGAIIGLIWLPMILITVIGFFVMQRYFDAFAGALASGDYSSMGPEVLGMICFVIAALLLCTMMAVPVVQLALGTRKQGALIHFAFGAQEWRLFRGVMGLVGFLLIPLLLVSVAAGVLESSGGGPLGAAHGAQVVLVLYLLLAAALVYFALRFGLLLPALAVSETVPLLPRAWMLSAGNFWRIFVVVLAVLIPVQILSAVIQLAVEGPQAITFNPQASTAMAAAEFHAVAMNMPLTSGINFLIAPLLLGLLVGAGASVYRSVNLNRPVDEIV